MQLVSYIHSKDKTITYLLNRLPVTARGIIKINVNMHSNIILSKVMYYNFAIRHNSRKEVSKVTLIIVFIIILKNNVSNRFHEKHYLKKFVCRPPTF